MSKAHLMLRNRRLLPPIASLSAFDAVARTASFTGAAADLALTQSAVSREIKSLEERLGVKLFNRTRQGVLLTFRLVRATLSVCGSFWMNSLVPQAN